jgi:CxxC-x17-CxxC domain-containing protein
MAYRENRYPDPPTPHPDGRVNTQFNIVYDCKVCVYEARNAVDAAKTFRADKWEKQRAWDELQDALDSLRSEQAGLQIYLREYQERRDASRTAQQQSRQGRPVAQRSGEQFEVTCSDCGLTTRVPFSPVAGKPVYCRACLQKHRR